MVRSELSEFSYGFAVTTELLQREKVAVAPYFPTLAAEGKEGGGFDLEVLRNGRPFFVQFKLSQRMSEGGKEAKRGKIASPYYRFKLHPRDGFVQHRMLLALEAKGENVAYVAPLFHSLDEFNSAFRESQVIDRSVFIPPTGIGDVDRHEKSHSVSFNDSDTNAVVVSSEPRTRQTRTTFSQMLEVGGENWDGLGSWESLYETMQKIVYKLDFKRSSMFEKYQASVTDDGTGRYRFFQQISSCARFAFNCELFILSGSSV